MNLIFLYIIPVTFRILTPAPWLRRLVAGLSQRTPGFDPRSVYMRFVVDKVTLGQVFHRVLRFTLSVSFHQWSTFIFIRITNGRRLKALQKALIFRKSDRKVLSLFSFLSGHNHKSTLTPTLSESQTPSAQATKQLWIQTPQNHPNFSLHPATKCCHLLPSPQCDYVKALTHDVKPVSVRTTTVTVTKFPYQKPSNIRYAPRDAHTGEAQVGVS